MEVEELELEGVKIFIPKYFEDYRGYYVETYSSRTMAELGIHNLFVQDNEPYTKKKGTIRGIHFQNNPYAQAKLLRCTRGRIMDFAVDLRKDSPTLKKWVAVEISEDNRKQIYIPAGFGHALITLEDDCVVRYKVDHWYEPEADRTIAWNDPEIGIDWGIENPILSEKDAKAPFLKDSDVNFSIKDNK